MPGLKCDVLIVGGGVGGCAAALSACRRGLGVVMAEPTAWIGGQFTSQAVPPDEHPWIEHLGCTRSYRQFRDGVRRWYRDNRRLTPKALAQPYLNPGNGWVSKLCFEPKVGLAVLESMLEPFVLNKELTILRRCLAVGAELDDDLIRAVTFLLLESGQELRIEAKRVLDATETGDLLPLAGVEYRLGSESKAEFGEPHAPDRADRNDVQGFTWCFAMGFDPHGDHRIAEPQGYGRWRAYRPSGWPGPMLDFTYPNPITLEPRQLPLFGSAQSSGWFDYRQIVDRRNFEEGGEDATIVNWPQNDYFEGNVLDTPPSEAERALTESRELSLSLLYWLQNEALKPDGGAGYPGLHMRPDLTGTDDGLAMAPYFREARRIVGEFTVLEQHVSAACHPGLSVAPSFSDSVGIGAYRLDLHPSASGSGYIDISTLPFEIPLGSLIPVRVRNLLAAGKCISVSHLANGCYRLHPVEWAIGEAAGLAAAISLELAVPPTELRSGRERLAFLQNKLVQSGAPLRWEAEWNALPAQARPSIKLGAL